MRIERYVDNVYVALYVPTSLPTSPHTVVNPAMVRRHPSLFLSKAPEAALAAVDSTSTTAPVPKAEPKAEQKAGPKAEPKAGLKA